MEYQILTQEERDDAVARALRDRENDYFQHSLDLSVRTEMLRIASPEPNDFKDKLQAEADEIAVMVFRAELWIRAYDAELGDRKVAAIERIKPTKIVVIETEEEP